MEDARSVAEAHGREELRRRQHSALAEQGPELMQRHEERDEVDERERALEGQTREPVVVGAQQIHARRHGAP